MELLRRYSNQTDVLSDLTTVRSLPTETRDPSRCKPKQEQRRLRELQQEELVEAYGAGESVYGLADVRRSPANGVSRPRTSRCAASISDPDNAGHRRSGSLYESGLSLVAVGERLGVNASTILNALRTTDVK